MNGLKYIRNNEMNMTMENLAEQLDVSKQVICMWESGKKKIPEKRLIQLENISGIPQKYFVIEDLSEREKLEIKSYCIKKDIQTSVRYEADEDDEENIKTIHTASMSLKTARELLFNLFDLQVNTLEQKIHSVIYEYDGNDLPKDDISEKEMLEALETKRRAFERFVDIIAGTKNYKVIFHVLQALELFEEIEPSENDTWVEKKLIGDLKESEEDLTQEILKVLNKNRDEEKERLKNKIRETERLLKILEGK